MTIVRQDTFTRANVASGWGTATDGNTWTSQAGTGGYNVTSNEGVLTGASSASYYNTLGAVLATADANALVRFSPQTGTSNDNAGMVLRFTNTNNWYMARWNATAAQMQFLKKVGGTTTTVGTYAISITAGQKWWLRFEVQGSTINIRTWQDGNSEPSTWNYTTTDTGLSAAGYAGIYGFAGASGQNLNYDSFSVDDLQSGSTSWNQTASETTSGLDTLSNQPTKPYGPETTSGQDVFAKQVATTRSEQQSALDTLSLFAAHALAKTVVDWQSGTDLTLPTLIKAWRQAVSDAHSALDTPTQTLSHPSGVGIGGLFTMSSSINWYGGPTGSPGTELRVVYADSTSSGWALGFISPYGADTISSVYELDAASYTINQTSLSTSTPDGHLHWLEDVGATFAGSEDKPYTLSELAPTGTDFRRYYSGSFGPDANGFNWTVYSCIYPGDPGFVAYRFDCINPSGSAITLNNGSGDAMEFALLGGLQQTDGTWLASNGGYGTVGGANTAGWPASATGADPDYIYITPVAGKGVSIGQFTVRQKAWTSISPAWTTPALVYLANGARLKLKVQGGLASFPASTTCTIYLLNGLRRSLTSADAAAIAADYLAPGTPTTSVGTYTTYSYDERAWVFAASGNALTATLDMSPAHVTVRYKPVLKLTGWTASAPSLTFNGTTLTRGVDFRSYTDTTNHICYIQLYFDVVGSGATTGQRNNGSLVVSAAVTNWNQNQGETFSELESRQMQAQHLLLESESALDALVKQTLRTLFEWSSALESSVRQPTKQVSDLFSLTDALQRATNKSLSETLSTLDTLAKMPARTLVEWWSGTDATTSSLFTGNAWSKTVSDTTSALDLLLGKSVTHYSAETLSALDTWTRAWVAHLTLVELLSGQDALAKQVTRFVAGETTFAQDTLSTLRYRLLTLSESFSSTDLPQKAVNKAFVEALSARDALSKQTLRTLFEQMSAADQVSATRVLLHLLQESLTGVDSVTAWVTHPGGLPHLSLSIALLASALGLSITLTPVASGLALTVTLV